MYKHVAKLKIILTLIGKSEVQNAFLFDSEDVDIISPMSYFNDLPEEITIYRGGDALTVQNGICWSLDRNIANQFCSTVKLARYRADNPLIIEKTINKNDIFGLVLDRCELEVIWFG
jgi:hypothetical protein